MAARPTTLRRPAWLRQPRRVVATAVVASVLLAIGGAVGGRLAAPQPAPERVVVRPIAAGAPGDPIVRPERLELPR
jgi:hypothetical protein